MFWLRKTSILYSIYVFGIDRQLFRYNSLCMFKRNRTKLSAKSIGIITARIFAYLIDYVVKMRLAFMQKL